MSAKLLILLRVQTGGFNTNCTVTPKSYANGRDLLLIGHPNLSVVNVQWNDTEVTFLMSIQPPLNIEKPLELLSQKPWMYAGRWKYKRDLLHWRWVIDEQPETITPH